MKNVVIRKTKNVKMRVLKFGSNECGPCRELARRKTMEVFANKHPDVELIVHNSKTMEDEKDPANQAMDEYEIKALPTVVFETPEGEELFRDAGAITLAALEEMYEEAIEALEEGNGGDDDEGNDDDDDDDDDERRGG